MAVDDLTKKKCVPCEGDAQPLKPQDDEAQALLAFINGGPLSGGNAWRVGDDQKTIVKEFRFKDFRAAQGAVNAIADVAESEGHHPDIEWLYAAVTITLWTHAIDGLSENDFILAAKIEKALEKL